MVDGKMGSLCCGHCGNFHPSSKWCECEGAKKHRENSILRQLQTIDEKKESGDWEYFQDSSYYDMFCVRRKNERQFGKGFHLPNSEEAKQLCSLLNELTVSSSESRVSMKNVSFTARIGRKQETKNIDSLGELIRLINGGCPITNLRVVEDNPNNPSKGPNADVITVVDEPYQAKCIHCGSPVTKQVFGPSAYIQGTANLWMCSNSEVLKGHCRSWIGYLSLEEWNSANQGEEVRENESNIQEPDSTITIPNQPIYDRNGDIIDIIKYQATCRQELIKAGLWTEELEALRIKAYGGIDSLCRENHTSTSSKPSLQERKDKWMRACFDDEITDSPEERNRRFIEEALELVQSLGMTRHEAHFMVDYVFDRDRGEPFQEVGGSLLCLAALCNVHKIDMMEAGETELSRVWTKVEAIRGKQKQKPNFIDDLDWIINTASPAVMDMYDKLDHEDLVGSFRLALGLIPREDIKNRYNTTSKLSNLVEAVQIRVKPSLTVSIPVGMRRWFGGHNGPPSDWNGGKVLHRGGIGEDPFLGSLNTQDSWYWEWNEDFAYMDIIAYFP